MKPEIKSKIEEVKALRKTYLDKLSDAFEDVLKSLAGEIFERDAGIKGISWVQYTPYFNDGDPCTFSIYDAQFCMSPEDVEQNETFLSPESEIELDEETFVCASISGYGLDERSTPSQKARFKPLVELLSEVDSVLATFEEAAQDFYGDGVRVFVTREGITTEEYNHD
ncbi:MAG: hypothetical protein E6R04_01745 [Spirochaetes bacterium]|nr:MAG: hypothetical protein E6R04_01745 [Spirochaetota bacterium]